MLNHHKEDTIESVLKEKRIIHPPSTFSANARIKSFQDYEKLYQESISDSENFWGNLAEKELHWFNKWDRVLEWDPPHAKWFVNGKLNITYNCIDRHLTSSRRNKPAIVWEGEPGDSRTLTYEELHVEVCKFANVLKQLKVTKGDCVAIYMPMIPEAIIAMLACARIGSVHTVIFGGFSAESLKDRLKDSQAKILVTADGGFRKDKIISLKSQVDIALKNNSSIVEKVVVVKRTSESIAMEHGRDYWLHDLQQDISDNCPPEIMDSEDALFILYTSGSTGKPKGVVHTIGGYSLYTHITTKWIFDIQDTDTYWCTADIGWITGHSYGVYGPLSNGATSLFYEGVPRPSNPGCFWDIIERYKVNIFYTAPTAIRSFIKMGDDIPKKFNLSSLRLLGTVGEPINPEVWMWYYEIIGNEKCPIVDTWWQTETGGVMITSLPGAISSKPGSASLPFPGIVPDIVDKNGDNVPDNTGGLLIIKNPWPSMLRNIHGDRQRFEENYWNSLSKKSDEHIYFSGDSARRDSDGYFWILGRTDDVMNISGHRLGSMELESALVSHQAVNEASVVGKPHEIKGEDIYAFVTLNNGFEATNELISELKQHVVQEIGAIARPGTIQFTRELPKTRSGKIVRRFLRQIAANQNIKGDRSTIVNPDILDELKEQAQLHNHKY